MSQAQAQLRHKQRQEIESTMIKLALEGGPAAIERQVKLLSRFRAQAENKPGLVDFVDTIDWSLECCYRQHPAYTEAIAGFVASIA